MWWRLLIPIEFFSCHYNFIWFVIVSVSIILSWVHGILETPNTLLQSVHTSAIRSQCANVHARRHINEYPNWFSSSKNTCDTTERRLNQQTACRAIYWAHSYSNWDLVACVFSVRCTYGTVCTMYVYRYTDCWATLTINSIGIMQLVWFMDSCDRCFRLPTTKSAFCSLLTGQLQTVYCECCRKILSIAYTTCSSGVYCIIIIIVHYVFVLPFRWLPICVWTAKKNALWIIFPTGFYYYYCAFLFLFAFSVVFSLCFRLLN